VNTETSNFGVGALVRVSTLDLANLPRTSEGRVDFAQVFFGREAFLTVSGQLNVEAYCLAMDVLAGDRRDRRRQPARGAARRVGRQLIFATRGRRFRD
jgi:hypothetical protein